MELFERLCELIIRPERHLYRVAELGPRSFVVDGQRIDRHDTQLPVGIGKIHVSLFQPRDCKVTTCVVYLHSNSGSRLEANAVKDMLASKGLPVCVFDFRGSGLSTGQYVSYGHHEKTDLKHVLDWLVEAYAFESFVLWGRSMGAATALMYAANAVQHKILLTIADSAYINLWELLEEIGTSKIGIPHFLVKPMLYLFEGSIKESAGFALRDIDLEADVRKARTPVVFIASKTDSIVPISHSQRLYKHYRGINKQLFYIDEDHQLERKAEDLDKLVKLIGKMIQKQKLLSNPDMKTSMILSRRMTLDQARVITRWQSAESLISNDKTAVPASNRSHYKINVVSRKPGLAVGQRLH